MAKASADGYEVLRARGSEMERDFGFGLVRQLFEPALRSLDPADREELFAGPAGLAAAIFGLAGESLEVGAAESSLYGLFWLLVWLAERAPVALVVDDAHWADSASLRFVRYLGRRLDGLPILIALAARPSEPGVQAELLRELVVELEPPKLSPAPLSEVATAALVRARLGAAASSEVEAACHGATGGNPFLIGELLTELAADGKPAASAAEIASMGPERIATAFDARARRVDPLGPELMRAAAVLGDAADRRALAALVDADRTRVGAVVDGLTAAAILAPGPGNLFVHPLVRTAVYEGIAAGARAELHARAATVLTEQGAGAEEVAAHLLRCEPGSVPGTLAILDAATADASERGAPDSAAAYLARALDERPSAALRADLLRRLGGAEVIARNPAAISHLREAAELTDDPASALGIYVDLADLLALAGQWDAGVQVVDAGIARCDPELPGYLDLEAFRAAYRGYDPAAVAAFDRDLPRLRTLVATHPAEESVRLRWVLASLGSVRNRPRAEVEALIGPADQEWSLRRDGRETSTVIQAGCALLGVEAFEETRSVARELTEDGRRRGSLMAMIAGVGFNAACAARTGDLWTTEAELGVSLELVERNEMSLMALTTIVHYCIDALVERHALEGVAELALQLELPPPFDATQSGGMLLETRAAIRAMRGDRAGAGADLRAAGAIFLPLQAGPRFSRWRSRLALVLPDSEREEALALAGEELTLARAVESPRAEGAALRALGRLTGGEAGIELLRESVGAVRDSDARLESAHSLAELGAALRRANQRGEARERLREAADLAQRCGAERLEQRVHEELRIAGARPRRRALSGVASLTPGERRVAIAAAAGASNREIAQDLFVSLRTVEMHLTNAYRKLDISSRTELAAAIDETAAAPAPEPTG